MIRILHFLGVFSLSAILLIPAWGAKEPLDWYDAVVQAVTPGQHYTVVKGSKEYVLRPYSTNAIVAFAGGLSGQQYTFISIPVSAGDHVQIAGEKRGVRLRDGRGKEYSCLIISQRMIASAAPPPEAPPKKETVEESPSASASSGLSNSKMAPSMTNEDVLRLKSLAFSDDLIIASIKAAKSTDFHISADDLSALREEGISEAVLIEMLNAAKREQK
jgi:hypothetical protein